MVLSFQKQYLLIQHNMTTERVQLVQLLANHGQKQSFRKLLEEQFQAGFVTFHDETGWNHMNQFLNPTGVDEFDPNDESSEEAKERQAEAILDILTTPPEATYANILYDQIASPVGLTISNDVQQIIWNDIRLAKKFSFSEEWNSRALVDILTFPERKYPPIRQAVRSLNLFLGTDGERAGSGGAGPC